MKKYFVLIVVILFLILSGIFYALGLYAPNFSISVLMTGNAVMALLTILSYFLITKQFDNKPAGFVRGVYASSLLKLFVCITAIMAYVMINKPNVHKPSLFVLFGIYAVYSIVETWLLSRLAKDTK